MRNRDTREETEDESSLFDKVRGRSEDQPEQTRTESDSLFGRAKAKYGLGALLVAIGVVLFVFPEPATSTIGIVLVAVGVLIWLVSWLR